MKRLKRMIVVSVLIGTLAMLGVPKPADAHVGVSLGFFYDELSPYGRWVDCSYGIAWVPAGISPGWQPYCNGEWIYTDYGWTWVSYDPWGGDPFHYGAWAWNDPWGWIWVPGLVWAPAWVTWYDADSCIGWAPLGPSFTVTAGGYFGDPVVGSRSSYVFVPTSRFAGTSIASVRLPVSRNATFLRDGRPATRFAVSGGMVREAALPFGRVQAAMGGRVTRFGITAAGTDPQPVRGMGTRFSLAAPARVERAALAGRFSGSQGRVTITNHTGPVVSNGTLSHTRGRAVISNRSGAVVSNGTVSHVRGYPTRTVTRVPPRTSTWQPNRTTWSPGVAPRRVYTRPVAPPIQRGRVTTLPDHRDNRMISVAHSNVPVAPRVNGQVYQYQHGRTVRRVPTPRPPR